MGGEFSQTGHQEINHDPDKAYANNAPPGPAVAMVEPEAKGISLCQLNPNGNHIQVACPKLTLKVLRSRCIAHKNSLN